jgi:hypothetical protein
MHNHSIDELWLLLRRHARSYRCSLLEYVQLLAVKDSNCNPLRIFGKDVSFIIELPITRKIYFPISTHSFIGCFDELFRGSAFREIPKTLGDFYSWSAIEFETDKFCLVIHEHIMRE